MSENSQNDLPTFFVNFQKFSGMFGNARKTSEIFRIGSEVYEIFRNIPISYTCGLKIGFKNSDL